MGPVDQATELRQVCDLFTPSLPTTEFLGTGWLPNYRHRQVRGGTDEVPLSTAEASWLTDKNNLLGEVSGANVEPSYMWATQVGADEARSDFTPMGVDPLNAFIGGTRTTLDESGPSERVQIQM